MTVTPATSLQDALGLMHEGQFRRLPVVDEDNHVVGVITETDVFRAFIDIYRAGHSGLYLTLEVPDRKGMVVELSRAIFDLGGNIVSVSSFYDDPMASTSSSSEAMILRRIKW